MEQLESMIFQFHAMSYNQNIIQITLVIYAAAYQSPEQLFPSTRHTAHSIPYQEMCIRDSNSEADFPPIAISMMD